MDFNIVIINIEDNT